MNEKIQIIPLFNEESIELGLETLGPFRIDFPIEVPLWLGVFLLKKGKCQIQMPDDYSIEILERKLIEEKS